MVKKVQGHELKPIRESSMPEFLLFVDTETTQYIKEPGKIHHKLMLGVSIFLRRRRDGKQNQKDVHRFNDIREFWRIVGTYCYSKTVLYLISHNAVFDFTILQHITNLSEMGYKCLFCYEGGVRFISKWRKGNHSIVILDNSNWFAGKLARWGKELNLPKLKMPKSKDDKERWFIYCERDTEILYQLFLWYVDFLTKNNLGKWQYTIASSAFTSYRHRFMTHPIYIPNEDDEKGLARDSYHGGRTECFRIGEFTNGPYYKLDINSMYPYVMRDYDYPTCFEGYHIRPLLSKVHKTLQRKCIIADVLVDTPIPYYVYKSNGRNIYPIGRFRTTLTTEELKLGFDNGWIQYVYACAVYRKRKIFTDYVDFFYRVKQDAGVQGQKLLRAFAKLYLNSLYGKFGQRGFLDKVIGEEENEHIRVSHGFNVQTGQRFTLRQIGKQVIYSEKGGESYNAFCAIASHVTATARLYLYSAILQAGRKNVYYCDTDSVIVNETGFKSLERLLDDQKLGYWKTEEISPEIAIVAPKHYKLNGHWKRKGVRNNAVELEENVYAQSIWPGFNTILKTGLEEYFVYGTAKHLRPNIVSGEIVEQGYIIPFEIK